MRLFFAAIVLYALPNKGNVGGLNAQDHPVGLAHFMDLTWIPGSLETCWWVMAVALLFYVAGRFMWLALPVATFVFCAVGGLLNSQGVARHTLQVVGLILVVQSVYYVLSQVRLWRKSKARVALPDQHRIAVWYAQQTVAAAYVITAVTKIINSGGEWIKDSKYFPLQIEKTRLSNFYNRLGVADAGPQVPEESAGLWERAVGMLDGLSLVIQSFLVANPNMCRTFMAVGLALEFFAFMALRGRLALFLYGLALIGFHLTISRVMELHFTVHNLVILTFLVNVPFVFILLWSKMSSGGLPVLSKGGG